MDLMKGRGAEWRGGWCWRLAGVVAVAVLSIACVVCCGADALRARHVAGTVALKACGGWLSRWGHAVAEML